MTTTDHQPDRHRPESRSDRPEPDHADSAEPPPAATELVGEVLLVDPATLVIGANIRLDPQLDTSTKTAKVSAVTVSTRACPSSRSRDWSDTPAAPR